MRKWSKIIVIILIVAMLLGNVNAIVSKASEDQNVDIDVLAEIPGVENREEMDEDTIANQQVVEDVVAEIGFGLEQYFVAENYDLSAIKTLEIHSLDNYGLNGDDLCFLEKEFSSLSVIDITKAKFLNEECFREWKQYCDENDVYLMGASQVYEIDGGESEGLKAEDDSVGTRDVSNEEMVSKKTESIIFHGIYVVEKGIHIEAGANCETDEEVQFRWLVYDIEHQTWERISEFSESNWVTWTPDQAGNYWLCVEIKNSEGEIKNYTVAYTWKGIFTRLTGMCIENKGTHVEAGVAFETSDPGVKFQWMQYDLKDQKWSTISDLSESNWVTWKPHTPGRYWLCVHAIDTLGNVTEYICDYTWPGFITNISGIYVMDKGTSFDMGACYNSDDSEIRFRWKIYNLEKKEWKELQGLSSSNWVTWSPTDRGNYWIHVEALDRNGVIVSYTMPYFFKGVSTELQQICVIEKEKAIDLGIAYTSNDAKLQFRWLLYNVADNQWSLISDWNNGNWITWKPEEVGEYWFWVEARTYDGRVIPMSYVYQVKDAEITSFEVTPDSPNWIGEKVRLTVEYRDFFDEIYTSRFLIYDGKNWTLVAENNKNIEWVPDKLGGYLLCHEVYDQNGQLLDQVFKAYNIERPYVDLKGIYVRDNRDLNLSMGVVYDSNDRELEFRWLYYDLAKGEWHILSDWNSSNWFEWRAPAYGNYWLHAEARLHNGEVKTYTIGYSIIEEPADIKAMRLRANMYSSVTPYILMVNRSTHKVGVFQGWQGSWRCIQYWDCSDGAPNTPTVEGTFRIGSRGYYFDSGASRCFWYTQFYEDYLFHSVLYNKYNGSLMDGRLGMALSHGCVRLHINNAKWIYDTIPTSTSVVVYH